MKNFPHIHSNNKEKTLIIIKPHPEKYTQKSQEFFAQKIQMYVEENDCQILEKISKNFDKNEAILHYKHLSLVPFFSEIIDYMTSGKCEIFLIEGKNAIKKMNDFKRKTRKEFGCHPGLFDWMYNKKPIYNILHTSDSKSEAKREIKRYFGK